MKTKISVDFQICISVPLSHVYRYYFGRCSSEPAELVPGVNVAVKEIIGTRFNITSFMVAKGIKRNLEAMSNSLFMEMVQIMS